jgi:hypothetical protein
MMPAAIFFNLSGILMYRMFYCNELFDRVKWGRTGTKFVRSIFEKAIFRNNAFPEQAEHVFRV